jgi:phosphatidylserine/phosphatidylglycerophosphate/cardiolipin synthase-like enzyme
MIPNEYEFSGSRRPALRVPKQMQTWLGSAPGYQARTYVSGQSATPSTKEIRQRVLNFVNAYVPSKTGDGRFEVIAQDYGGVGTTCGFLVHAALWVAGCTNKEIVNRNVPKKVRAGEKREFTYVNGANISRIYRGGKFPFKDTYHTGFPQSERPSPGDIIFISNGPEISKTGQKIYSSEHVFIFLREVIENGKTYWESADAGQRDQYGKEYADIIRREFRTSGNKAILGSTSKGFRFIYGWLPLEHVEFGPARAFPGMIIPATAAPGVLAYPPHPSSESGMPSNPPQIIDVRMTLERFQYKKAMLENKHREQITDLVRRIQVSYKTSKPIRLIKIVGHTDPVGSDQYNMNLGLQRAKQVQARIIQEMKRTSPSLISRTQFQVSSLGEQQPISQDPAVNRRVEISALSQPNQRPTGPRPPSKPNPQPPSKPSNAEAGKITYWFNQGPTMQPVRKGNMVTTLVRGIETFKDMYNTLLTATGEGHYIYWLAWWMDLDLELIPGKTVLSLLTNAGKRGVQIRVMLWDQAGRKNSNEVDWINKIPNAKAILDNETLNFGSHHQKILVVNGVKGLIAYCGGIDPNCDRLPPGVMKKPCKSASSGSGSTTPLHDVHGRIEGPVAYDLLTVFRQRWLNHPKSVSIEKTSPLLGHTQSIPKSRGNVSVQIGRTFGSKFKFAPHGEKTIQIQVLRAIAQARKFIYIEDQYLVNLEIRDALEKALASGSIQFVVIVIPHSSITTPCPSAWQSHRKDFIDPLVSRFGSSRVRVFNPYPVGSPYSYVHSKMWIFDDEFLIMGSANINLRGYTHDSEVMAAIYDHSKISLVKQLRMRLWSIHLGLDYSANEALLNDVGRSESLWLRLPPSARVERFDASAKISGTCLIPWRLMDPRG